MKPHRINIDAVYAIVPVKALRISKARLAPVLSASNRSRLSAAMLLDVLRALRRVSRIHSVTVVSCDRSVRAIARQMGAHFLWEGRKRGLNRALRLAIGDAIRRRAATVLIIPSDIPLINPKAVRSFLKLSDGYAVGLARAKDGNGTNALLLRPPGVVSPAFGGESFLRHVALARRKGASARVVRSRVIATDVDKPSDLAEIKRLHLRNETGRLLEALRR